MTKVAEVRPSHCACCYGQPEGRYVDFEAAYDGPVIPGTPEPVPIDDLILCESCLAEAFVLLDPDGLRITIGELEQVVADLLSDNEAKDRAIQGFRSTTNELIDHPVASFPGKPKLEGITDELRERITKARYERSSRSRRARKAAA
jgi:hypothetical protein